MQHSAVAFSGSLAGAPVVVSSGGPIRCHCTVASSCRLPGVACHADRQLSGSTAGSATMSQPNSSMFQELFQIDCDWMVAAARPAVRAAKRAYLQSVRVYSRRRGVLHRQPSRRQFMALTATAGSAGSMMSWTLPSAMNLRPLVRPPRALSQQPPPKTLKPELGRRRLLVAVVSQLPMSALPPVLQDQL
eukprot:jgi/Chlat1/2356/Chrsp17S02628